ncbi:MAG TPA: outer membrane lipid asymmetry maintenance protein MlaD [Solimonas sp.]|nr:outer membrane lipid asymmetry maintenance protein MlaD [Solimonas sp.]
MQSRVVEILVGFFVCLGIAAMMLLTFRVASLRDVGGKEGSYKVSAEFENIGKLGVGSAVRVAGVRIGRVAKISVDPHTFEALVNIEISQENDNIPKDSSAQILTAGLLGEQYIGIEAGGDEATLKDGDRIRFTQSALVLENLVGQFLTNMASKQPTPEK